MMCFDQSIRKCRKKLSILLSQKHLLEDKGDDDIFPGSKMEVLINQIDSLIEGDYSRAVFDHYAVKTPCLIREHTGEEVQWEEAFGNLFDQTTPSQRHSLVGLIEGGGKYRFK